ncbi:MAG: hypothetical protein L0G22_08805, partial [Propionibacteriaceae bacterium]|nr:hypothetical protein [Propionibacteriaceae bacterium]
MSPHEPRALMSVEEYAAELLALVAPDARVQTVPLAPTVAAPGAPSPTATNGRSPAAGRVLAEPVTSPIAVPPFA